MAEETEKTVKKYGQIMELCFLEASRIVSSNAGPELCRQITHDLFEAVIGASEKAAELDVLTKLQEAADTFSATRQGFLIPFAPGVPDFVAKDSESAGDRVPFEPENGE